jgi:hypothetical protein
VGKFNLPFAKKVQYLSANRNFCLVYFDEWVLPQFLPFFGSRVREVWNISPFSQVDAVYKRHIALVMPYPWFS